MMAVRSVLLVILAACALAASADTVFKYRDAAGQTVYANRPLPGLELIEAFEYRFPEPPPEADAARRTLEAERRIAERLRQLEAAWEEVQAASRALAAAEARRLEGVEPAAGEARGLAGQTAPPAPVVGGPQPSAPPQAGGPLGARRGGGRQPEYHQRMERLEAEVAAARARLSAAWQRYHALR